MDPDPNPFLWRIVRSSPVRFKLYPAPIHSYLDPRARSLYSIRAWSFYSVQIHTRWLLDPWTVLGPDRWLHCTDTHSPAGAVQCRALVPVYISQIKYNILKWYLASLKTLHPVQGYWIITSQPCSKIKLPVSNCRNTSCNPKFKKKLTNI